MAAIEAGYPKGLLAITRPAPANTAADEASRGVAEVVVGFDIAVNSVGNATEDGEAVGKVEGTPALGPRSGGR